MKLSTTFLYAKLKMGGSRAFTEYKNSSATQPKFWQ